MYVYIHSKRGAGCTTMVWQILLFAIWLMMDDGVMDGMMMMTMMMMMMMDDGWGWDGMMGDGWDDG